MKGAFDSMGNTLGTSDHNRSSYNSFRTEQLKEEGRIEKEREIAKRMLDEGAEPALSPKGGF